MSDAARPQWAGQRAMSWVIDDAPVPTALFPVLMVIARRCGEDGRGSYQSVPTIAEKTGKSPDQVKKDIRELLKAGLLLPGDESLVAHYPVWSRPKVYDVPLHISGPKPTKEGRNKQGVNRQGGCMDTPGGTGTRGCMEAPGGGGMDTPGVGVRVHPKESLLKTQENNPSSPNPSTPNSALEVVDAEIVEAEEASTSSKDQLQNLIDEIRTIRPNWKPHEIRTHVGAVRSMLGDNDEAVAHVALATAKDPDSAKPSRITASGNPHLQRAKTTLMVIAAENAPPPPLHPEAHAFELKADSSGDCKHCPFPKANGRHRVGNQGGGYIGRSPAAAHNQKHQTFKNPTHDDAYEGEL